jgi:hypothetical protein
MSPTTYWETADKTLATAATITVSPSIAQVSQVVIAANPNRKGLILYNNGANTIYLTFGPTSSSSLTVCIPLATFASYLMTTGVIYTGVISGIRNAGSGTVIATELT